VLETDPSAACTLSGMDDVVPEFSAVRWMTPDLAVQVVPGRKAPPYRLLVERRIPPYRDATGGEVRQPRPGRGVASRRRAVRRRRGCPHRARSGRRGQGTEGTRTVRPILEASRFGARRVDCDDVPRRRGRPAPTGATLPRQRVRGEVRGGASTIFGAGRRTPTKGSRTSPCPRRCWVGRSRRDT
jgi:hypothetical protein